MSMIILCQVNQYVLPLKLILLYPFLSQNSHFFSSTNIAEKNPKRWPTKTRRWPTRPNNPPCYLPDIEAPGRPCGSSPPDVAASTAYRTSVGSSPAPRHPNPSPCRHRRRLESPGGRSRYRSSRGVACGSGF